MKKNFIKLKNSKLFILLNISLEYKQYQPEDEALCGLCGLFAGAAIIIPIVLFIISIALLVWVARDAKNRGMDNPAIWMIIVFFLNLLGLIIYLLSRPSGRLVYCKNCNNRKLEALKTCPHCGHKPE
jgi:hypothetical protein